MVEANIFNHLSLKKVRNDFNQCKFTYYMDYYKTSNL
nr:MAG TPA: hypothetical protein [Caudoviricetes sp.]